MEKSREIKYIKGLKGFACFMIMLGHYLGLYKYAEHFAGNIKVLDLILESKFAFLLSESFWLYLFLIISGFLVSKCNIYSLNQLIKRVLLRFLRFGIPIVLSYSVIFVFYRIIGFHNNDLIEGISNKWFQRYYMQKVFWTDVLRAPLDVLVYKRVILNHPYWCLASMFIATVIIYIYIYIISKIQKKNIWFYLMILIVIGSLQINFDGVRTACLIGFVVYMVTNKKNWTESLVKSKYFSFVMILLSLSLYVYYERLILSFIFAVFFVYVGKCEPINNLFSTKIFQGLGEISWGVYSFHFPIFCSIGMKFFQYLSLRFFISEAYMIVTITCLFLTIVISYIYYFTLEKMGTFLLGKIKSFLKI